MERATNPSQRSDQEISFTVLSSKNSQLDISMLGIATVEELKQKVTSTNLFTF